VVIWYCRFVCQSPTSNTRLHFSHNLALFFSWATATTKTSHAKWDVLCLVIGPHRPSDTSPRESSRRGKYDWGSSYFGDVLRMILRRREGAVLSPHPMRGLAAQRRASLGGQQQPGALRFPVGGYRFEVESSVSATKTVRFFEDRDPRKPGLVDFEHQALDCGLTKPQVCINTA
jgi:hypothetical protein